MIFVMIGKQTSRRFLGLHIRRCDTCRLPSIFHVFFEEDRPTLYGAPLFRVASRVRCLCGRCAREVVLPRLEPGARLFDSEDQAIRVFERALGLAWVPYRRPDAQWYGRNAVLAETFGQWRVVEGELDGVRRGHTITLGRDEYGLAVLTPRGAVSLAGGAVWPSAGEADGRVIEVLLAIEVPDGRIVELQPLEGQAPEAVYDALLQPLPAPA